MPPGASQIGFFWGPRFSSLKIYGRKKTRQDAPAVSKLDSPKWLLTTVISTIAKGWLPGIMAVQSVLESRVPFLERCWKQRETCGFQMRSNTSTRIGLNFLKHETKSSLQYFCKGHGRSFHRSTTRWNGQALNSFPKQDGWFAKRIRPTNPNHSQICGSPGKFWAMPNWVLSTPLDDIRNLINTANFADSGVQQPPAPKNTSGR